MENTVKIVNVRNRENKHHININRVKLAMVRKREIILDDIEIKEYNSLLQDMKSKEKEKKMDQEMDKDLIMRKKTKIKRKRIINKIGTNIYK